MLCFNIYTTSATRLLSSLKNDLSVYLICTAGMEVIETSSQPQPSETLVTNGLHSVIDSIRAKLKGIKNLYPSISDHSTRCGFHTFFKKDALQPTKTTTMRKKQIVC